MVQITDYCGMVSGKTTDKSMVFTSFYDELKKAPMISQCPLNFLCKIMQSISICGFEVFFGEIVSTYLNEQCFTDGKPDPLKINPMIMMGASYFDLGQAVGNVFKEGAEYKKLQGI
jgi:flavin reductase (DIM6/NTAB) family NADH-FMN oxidoreductase RutF